MYISGFTRSGMFRYTINVMNFSKTVSRHEFILFKNFLFQFQWHLVDFRRERGNILEFIEFFRIIHDHCCDIVWQRAIPAPPKRYSTSKKPKNAKLLEPKSAPRRDRVASQMKMEIRKGHPSSISVMNLSDMSPISLRKNSAPNETVYHQIIGTIRPSPRLDGQSDVEDARVGIEKGEQKVSFNSTKASSATNSATKLFRSKPIVDVRKKSVV
jgi:hypothetical protein